MEGASGWYRKGGQSWRWVRKYERHLLVDGHLLLFCYVFRINLRLLWITGIGICVSTSRFDCKRNYQGTKGIARAYKSNHVEGKGDTNNVFNVDHRTVLSSRRDCQGLQTWHKLNWGNSER